MFGTKKVLANCVNMISCNRTRHGGYSKCCMFIFMTYMILLFFLQWFIVGAMFASIYSFFSQVFYVGTQGNWYLAQIYKKGILTEITAGIYIFLIVMTLILSLAMPLEKGKSYFTVVTIIFGALSTLSVIGIIWFFQ